MKSVIDRYDHQVKEYLKAKNFIHITITLDEKFLKDARDRIIEGHKKYGEDWISKDNLKEMYAEQLDLFNYPRIDEAQEEYWKDYINKEVL